MAKLHGAQIQDQEGIKLLLDIAVRDRLPERLSQLWLDAGYTGENKGADWVHPKVLWDGPQRSCDTHRSQLPRR
jgi:hypothetical protein